MPRYSPPLPFRGGPSGGPTRGLTRTSAARLRTGGEEESPRTGDSNPGCNCLVRGYSPSMHFFWGGDMPRYSPPLPFRGGPSGGPTRGLTRTSAARLRTGGEEESPRTGDSNPGCNCLVRGYSPSMHFFWGGDMPRYSPPLPFRGGPSGGPTRGLTRTSAARLRTGGEEESPRTGDSNPGCNCLVRGYSPSMHFFLGR